jgi:hypothetical protein
MLPRLRRLGHWDKVHGTYCLFLVLAPQASSRDEERSRGAETSTGLASATTARSSRVAPSITPSQRIPRDRERQEFDMSDTLDWNAKTIAVRRHEH